MKFKDKDKQNIYNTVKSYESITVSGIASVTGLSESIVKKKASSMEKHGYMLKSGEYFSVWYPETTPKYAEKGQKRGFLGLW